MNGYSNQFESVSSTLLQQVDYVLQEKLFPDTVVVVGNLESLAQPERMDSRSVLE